MSINIWQPDTTCIRLSGDYRELWAEVCICALSLHLAGLRGLGWDVEQPVNRLGEAPHTLREIASGDIINRPPSFFPSPFLCS